MAEKLKVKLLAELSNGPRNSTIIEIDKSEYDEAKDKEAFLQQIHDECISEIVTTSYAICED
ncbi:hypothetical protein [uncultured Gilliamella sp.]|uniref:hypothetical protein n=1 Tax=uncultured Gilliamella sp. TaxID=1193505 RepID=UPI0025EDDACA|nr:hypothetical protein [uncultured Gilliamella sp.]